MERSPPLKETYQGMCYKSFTGKCLPSVRTGHVDIHFPNTAIATQEYTVEFSL